MKTFAAFQSFAVSASCSWSSADDARFDLVPTTPSKSRSGETKDRPYWNEISIWSESARKYVRDYAKPGDLVVARGTLKQGSFEKDGEKVYTVDLNCDDFSILASAKTDKSDNDEADAVPETAKKAAKRK